uniref:Cytoplasmic phosphatidylinositol transfer protein 1 n=1 Tax=Anser brachyrhynchus TaxID=132585 RepID=A0A8B9D1A5_9AVES
MLVKEYRICMPLTTEEYRVGQLYTISKHSHQESEKGEGVEVVKNEPHEDPVHGSGQFTEKRVHLSSKLPSWARAVTPRIFYITEKAWNYYPYTITEYTCSFLPKFSIYIETKYEDNCGDSENIFRSDKILGDHEVSFLDIAFDEIPERYYRSLEDPRFFSSAKTGRGPLREGWRQHTKPIMCSYKLVTVKFEVWGLQTRVEQFVHKVIRDILLIGHRQAFTWVDEWCGESPRRPPAPAHGTPDATNLAGCSSGSLCPLPALPAPPPSSLPASLHAQDRAGQGLAKAWLWPGEPKRPPLGPPLGPFRLSAFQTCPRESFAPSRRSCKRPQAQSWGASPPSSWTASVCTSPWVPTSAHAGGPPCTWSPPAPPLRPPAWLGPPHRASPPRRVLLPPRLRPLPCVPPPCPSPLLQPLSPSPRAAQRGCRARGWRLMGLGPLGGAGRGRAGGGREPACARQA